MTYSKAYYSTFIIKIYGQISFKYIVNINIIGIYYLYTIILSNIAIGY